MIKTKNQQHPFVKFSLATVCASALVLGAAGCNNQNAAQNAEIAAVKKTAEDAALRASQAEQNLAKAQAEIKAREEADAAKQQAADSAAAQAAEKEKTALIEKNAAVEVGNAKAAQRAAEQRAARAEAAHKASAAKAKAAEVAKAKARAEAAAKAKSASHAVAHHSESTPVYEEGYYSAPAAPIAQIPAPAPIPVCGDCATITAITPVVVSGSTSGIGGIAGAVAGVALGNQIGKGKGKKAAKIAGAILGGIGGNEAEKQIRATTVYDVSVQMKDGGSTHTIRVNDATSIREGQEVHVRGNDISPM